VKRVVLLILALAAFAPSTAGAAVSCRDRIYNDWYHDGKIATSYPISCYRDALKHVPPDAREYSSLADDIRAALQGAIALKNGHTKVPGQVGTGGSSSARRYELSSTKTNKPPHDPTRDQDSSTSLPTSTVAAGATTGGGSGVPVPLLVLGGLALLLTAAGGVGVIAKRRRT
jgi:hypothetical protein